MNSKAAHRSKSSIVLTLSIVAAAFCGWQAPALLQKPQSFELEGDFSRHTAGKVQQIILYGTTGCPACGAARDYFKKAGIPFSDQNIEVSTEAKESYSKLGERRVPILVSKNAMVIGFDKPAYDRLVAAIYKK